VRWLLPWSRKPPPSLPRLLRARGCVLWLPAHAQRRLRSPVPAPASVGIEGLSPDDIDHIPDVADGYVELNQQGEKKRSLLEILNRDLGQGPPLP
jgi:hypothetical protein